ncbi:hypothetical protein AB0M41_38365 [Streptomyces sp. NPDC051896]|uniref:hypothetical protein n=1 Tax=Streptomyces sp. NPDC051896 TaxID=3155416 RepID=UPI00341785CF
MHHGTVRAEISRRVDPDARASFPRALGEVVGEVGQFEVHHDARRPHQAMNQAAPLRAVPEPITDPGRMSCLDIRR